MSHPAQSHTQPKQDYLLVFFVTLVVLSGIGLLIFTQNNITGALVIAPTAPLSCFTFELANASCPATYTKILGMSNFSNAHAELPNETNYNVSVCCRDPTGTATILNTSGTTVANLSNFTNAHAGLNGQTTYSIPVLIGSSVNGTSCFVNTTGEGTCGFGFTCLFTMSDTSNAHVANCTDPGRYNITTCCSIGGLVTRYFHPNTTPAANLTAIGSVIGNPLQDGNSSYTTQNLTYVNATAFFLEFTGNFDTQDVDARALTIEFNDTARAVNTSRVTGKSTNHDIWLPNILHNVGPRVCPDADNLSEVNDTCPNGTNFTGPYPKTISGITVSLIGSTYYRISPLTGSGVMILTAVNSTIENSNITNSSILNSTVNNSNITDSDVNNSNINNSNIINSTILDSNVSNSSVQDSLIDNSTLVNTSVVNSTVVDSTKINSTIINSSVQGSVNVNCTLVNTNENFASCLNSSITNSTITNLTVINATITNGFCSAGVIIFNGQTFNCPLFLFELSPLNLTFSKVDTPDPVTRGETLSYTIFLFNGDNQTATNLTLNDSYHPLVSFVSSQPAPDVGDYGFTVGNLAPGTGTTINITVLVNSGVGNNTNFPNLLNVSYNRPSGLAFFQQNTTTTTILGTPNLTGDKTANETFIIKGNQLNYTITVTNGGDEVAYNTTLTDGYPSGTIFHSSSPPPISGNNTFSLGNLAPGASTTITITLNVTSTIANGTVINNTFNVSANGTQGHQVNLTNSTTTLVIGFPILNLTKTSTPTSMVPGANVVYQITVTNAGDEIANNVVITEGYPGNISFVSSQPVPNVGNHTWNLGALIPGQTTTINITVTISSTATPQFLNNTVNATFVNSTNATVTQNTSVITTVLPIGGQGGGSNNMVGAQIIRPRTYTMDSDSFLTPYLNRKDTVIFKTDDGLHSLTVDEITLAQIRVTIESTPQTLSLSLGDRKEVDVNGDGTNDLQVVVVDVYRAQQTQIRLVRTRGAQTEIRPETIIRAPVEQPIEEEPRALPEIVPEPVTLPLAGQALRTDASADDSSMIGFLLASVIVFLAIGLLAYLLYYKRQPPQLGAENHEFGWKFRHK